MMDLPPVILPGSAPTNSGAPRCPRSHRNFVPLGQKHSPLALREPFRLFFPWALIAGIAGALLWPLFLWKQLSFAPHYIHARIMVEGLGGGFVLGFLSTALPRSMGAKPFSSIHVLAQLGLHVASVLLFLTNHIHGGDAFFAASLTLLLGGTLWKFAVQRTDMPPPAFLLVIMGLLCGISAAIYSVAENLPDHLLGSPLTKLLLYQGFLLLPILGVGAFLLPRILQTPSRQVFRDSKSPESTWIRLAALTVFVGALMLVSFWLEANGQRSWGCGLRAAVVIVWLSWNLPGVWWKRLVGSQAWGLRLGLWTLALSLLVLAKFPPPPYGLEHMVFVGGFGILFLGVASRVSDGHSGHREAARGKSRTMRWIVWLALLAATTRASADYFPKIQNSHYIYAAITWAIISVIWLVAYWRKLRTPDPEEENG